MRGNEVMTRQRHIFTQGEIVRLFKNGEINGIELRSHRGNYKATHQTITHYSTTEAIRTNNDTVIGSTQCWASGFASCAFFGGNCSLPLTTLDQIGDMHTIEILERNHNTGHILFSMSQRYFLYGHDEFRPFLTELKQQVDTINDAIKILTPIEARGKNVKRQGDLFFVKTAYTDKQVQIVDYEHYTKYCNFKDVVDIEDLCDEYPEYNLIVEPTHRSRYDHRYYDTRISRSTQRWGSEERVQMYAGKTALRNCVGQSCVRQYLGKHIIKEHHKPQILETNHKVNQIAQINGFYTLVKGQVSHDRHQHSRLDLRDAWYAVYKNLAKQSWQVDRRSSGGGD